MQIGELRDAQPVECLRQPVAVYCDAMHDQRAAARCSTLNQHARHTQCGEQREHTCHAPAAEGAHDVVGHARQREQQICEKDPHGRCHDTGGVVAYQPKKDDACQRQQIARCDERQKQAPVAVRSAVAAEIPSVGDERQQNQKKYHPHHS